MTLCGSCTNVCPVRINIHEQIYKWRQVISERGNLMGVGAVVLDAGSITVGDAVLAAGG